MAKSAEQKAKEKAEREAEKARKAAEAEAQAGGATATITQPEPEEVDTGKEPEESSEPEIVGDIEVGDPILLRPVELPLVIKPVKGKSWKNDEQARYAATLNGYAYKNPKKWKVKKNDRTVNGVLIKGLITKLVEIGENPEMLSVYASNDGSGLTFKNNLTQK